MNQIDALVSAYLMGARAKTHEDMVLSVKLAKQLEAGLSPEEVAKAKLRADVTVEREYHAPYG